MMPEKVAERRQIKQIAQVLSPAIAGKEEQFKILALQYYRSTLEFKKAEQAAFSNKGVSGDLQTLAHQAEQARLNRLRGERIMARKDDFVAGGLEVVKGRIAVLIWELGAKAPWWLELIGIKPSPEHPLVQHLRKREVAVNEQIRLLLQSSVDQSPDLSKQKATFDERRESFITFCNEQAAAYPYEKVAQAYVGVVPDQTQTVAQRYVAIHGLEEDWLRFFPKMVREVKRLVENDPAATRIAQSSLGILWDQLRPEYPSQLSNRAQRMWSLYLPYMLVDGWSEDLPQIPKPNLPILIRD